MGILTTFILIKDQQERARPIVAVLAAFIQQELESLDGPAVWDSGIISLDGKNRVVIEF